MSDTAAPTHAYAGQPDRPQKQSTGNTVLTVGSVLTTVIAVFLLLGLCVVQLWVVPRYIVIFQDFDTQLPSLTIHMLEVPTAMYLAVYGLGMLGLIAKECIPPLHSSIKLALNLIVIVLCLVMAIVYFLALQLPMISMMESLM